MKNQERLKENQNLLADAAGELAAIDVRRNEILVYIERLRQEQRALQHSDAGAGAIDDLITNQSPVESKIALFRSLFRGREDVYPR